MEHAPLLVPRACRIDRADWVGGLLCGRASGDRGDHIGELIPGGRVHLRQASGDVHDRRRVLSCRRGNLSDEGGGLDVVVVGGSADDSTQRAGYQVGSQTVKLHKAVKRSRDRDPARCIFCVAAMEYENTFAANRFGRQPPIVASVGKKNVKVLVSVDQVHRAFRAAAVLRFQLVRTGALNSDAGDTHQVPHADQDFRVASDEQEHLLIALDGLSRQATIQGWRLGDCQDAAASLGGEPVEGKPTDQLLSLMKAG